MVRRARERTDSVEQGRGGRAAIDPAIDWTGSALTGHWLRRARSAKTDSKGTVTTAAPEPATLVPQQPRAPSSPSQTVTAGHPTRPEG